MRETMKKIIGLIFGLLLLVACATQTISPEKTQVVTQEQARTEAEIDAQSTTLTLIPQAKADVEAKNVKSQDIIVPIVYKVGKIGSPVVFGVMINQAGITAGKTYFAKVTFVEGRDLNYNKIEADKIAMADWVLQKQSEDFVLEEHGSQFVPIVLEAQSTVKSGLKTPAGAYEFKIQFYTRDNSFTTQVDSLTKSVFLKVQ
jgi:hypothetical protein